MKLALPLLIVLLTLLLGGCAVEPAKPFFAESASQTISPPPRDQAQIIFLEPINSIQGMIPVGLFELSGDKRTLLATTGAHSKAALLFKPGRHLLMAVQGAGASHLLEANVEAGKRYYVLVRFIYANGFQLRPIRTTADSDYSVHNKDFPRWLAETKLVEQTLESEAFHERFKDSVSKAQQNGWASWQNKTPLERAELTLNPQDAVTDW